MAVADRHRSGSCLPFGPTTSSISSSINSCTTPSPTPTLSASSLSLAAPTKLAERFLDQRRERALGRLQARDDLWRGYLAHGGSSCPREILDLAKAVRNDQERSDRGTDRTKTAPHGSTSLRLRMATVQVPRDPAARNAVPKNNSVHVRSASSSCMAVRIASHGRRMIHSSMEANGRTIAVPSFDSQ